MNSVSSFLFLWATKRREIFILFFGVLTILFSIVCLSNYYSIPLIISVGLSILTFLFLFLPIGGIHSRETAKENFFRLLKFPPFWLGVLFFSYIAIQSFNPSITVTWRGFFWVLSPEEYSKYLPTCFNAEFDLADEEGRMNLWRQFFLFIVPFFIFCAMWIGVQSRRVWKMAMWVFIFLSLMLAIFGVARWINHSDTHIWGLVAQNSIFSLFSYQNHAAQFFIISLGITIAFAFRVWFENIREGRKSGPHILLAAFALVFFITTICTSSFAGILEAIIWLLIVSGIFIICRLLSKSTLLAFSIVFVLLFGLLGVWLATSNLKEVSNKISSKWEKIQKEQIDDRADLRKLSYLIWTKDTQTCIYGIGAGGYRWIAPSYQAEMPEFCDKNGNLTASTQHAHCDILEMLVEWGIIGTSFFVGIILWFYIYAIRNLQYWRISSCVIFCTVSFFILHSLFDFVSYNSSLLMTLAFAAAYFKITLRRKENLKILKNYKYGKERTYPGRFR